MTEAIDDFPGTASFTSEQHVCIRFALTLSMSQQQSQFLREVVFLKRIALMAIDRQTAPICWKDAL